MEQVLIGDQEDWVQETRIQIPKADAPDHIMTPDDGRVIIEHIQRDGTSTYWSGSAFNSSTPVELTTTIIGTKSTYPFTVPTLARGDIIRFEGWAMRNGYAIRHDYREVQVGFRTVAQQDFKRG